MTSLSIGIDARPLAHPNTGIGRYTDAVLSRLTESGHHFFLYATAPVETKYANCSVRIHPCEERRLQSTLAAQRYFPGWARSDELDLFWSPRHHLPLAMRCPSVVTVHDLVWRKVPQTMARFAPLLERALMSPSVRKASQIIAVSESTRHDLIEWLPVLDEKISVVPEAACVSPEDLSPPTARLPQRYFLFVGTFEPRKNLQRLVRAFASIANEIPQDLVLAGGRGWGPSLETTLHEIGDAAARIHRIHPEHNVAISELYARCESFVCPSLYEGFGLPLTEAMAFGKPILTSRNSSLPEVAGDAAIYVDAESMPDIAGGLKKLALDEPLRKSLSQKATERAGLFSWDAAAADTLSILEAAAQS